MGLLEILGGVLTGGATGLVGTVIGMFAKGAERKAKLADKRADHAHELNLIGAHAKDRAAERESEAAIVETQAALAARQASYDHDTGYGKPYKWVVSVLRLFRPVLTLGLVAGTFYVVPQILTVDPSMAQSLGAQYAYLVTTAITWWFGTRDTGKS